MIADRWQKAVVKSLILKGISILVFATGCSTIGPQQSADAIFVAAGKFGIQDGPKGFSARFLWQQYPRQTYEIDVWGPLGQGRLKLLGNPGRMELWRGAELLAQGPPEQVMNAHLGWSVPVVVLPAWIRGLPAKRLRHSQPSVDKEGRFTAFQQAGWQVELQRYSDRLGNLGELSTPGRIVATNQARKVTVVIGRYSP